MAIITPTGAPEALTGKIGGDVLFLWRGKLCRKKGTPARKIQTVQRAWGKHLTTYLDNQWAQLSATQQSCWDTYGSCAEINLTGFITYTSRNHRLLFSQHPDLIEIDDPFHEPWIPATPTAIYLSFVAASNAWLFTWGDPLSSTTYIQSWGWKRATFQDSKGAFFTLQQTINAECGQLTISSSGYQTGTVFEGRLRAINLYGEVSPWTNVLNKQGLP
jgi:hypothetical protein